MKNEPTAFDFHGCCAYCCATETLLLSIVTLPVAKALCVVPAQGLLFIASLSPYRLIRINVESLLPPYTQMWHNHFPDAGNMV